MKQLLSTYLSFGAVLYIFSLIGELGHYWWVFDLFSHWRTLYLLIGLILICVALALKKFKWLFTSSAILCYHLIVMAAYIPIFPAQQVRAKTSAPTEISVAFANTYWKNPDMNQVVEAITAMNADVIFLEEIQPEQFAIVSAQLPQYTFSLHAPVDFAFDMGVLSKVPVKSHTIHFFMPQVPLIEIVVENNGKDLHLMGVHPHSPVSKSFTADRNQYLKDLFTYVNNSPDSLVMGGDFNITQFSPVFRDLLAESRMIDTQSQFKLTSTWPVAAPDWVAIPIDQIFVSPDVVVTARYRGEATGSDHWPVVVRLGL